MINKRPFFSIIIPCYNSRKTIGRLLETIVQQKMDYNDIQVIISDDCSTESYQDIIDSFKDKLFITQVKTDYNCCPGNTRQKGVDNATGQWLCFADHDDFFVLESLPVVKEKILQSNCNTVFLTPFLKKTQKDQYIKMPIKAGWTHGRFYNLDNFWNKYNIHYIKDMASHQDVCISSQMGYIQQTYDITFCIGDFYAYVWNENPESLSNRKYRELGKQRIFLDKFFIDYMQSTAGVTYNLYHTTKPNEKYTRKNIMDVLLYSYFYLEYAKHVTPQYLKKNFDHVRKYIAILQDQFDTKIQDIYNYFKYEDIDDYKLIHNMAISQTDIILYQKSFKDWLYWIWDKQY